MKIKTMETIMKYELTDDAIKFNGFTLHRIKALKDFSDVKAGDLGGWIEKEENLSQTDNAWIGGNARVFGKAKVHGNAVVCDNARVYGNSEVCDNAEVYGNAWVYGKSSVHGNAHIRDSAEVYDNAEVYGNAWVYGNAEICANAVVRGNAVIRGDAIICGKADYIIFKNFWSSGRYFTWTRSNNMWSVGCFYGTGEELIEKAYADSEKSGKEYERVVKYVNSILTNK